MRSLQTVSLFVFDETTNAELNFLEDRHTGPLRGHSGPRRLQKLLADCRSVKVKRLFFFFADRHHHAWLKRLDKDAIDLGAGKRMPCAVSRPDETFTRRREPLISTRVECCGTTRETRSSPGSGHR